MEPSVLTDPKQRPSEDIVFSHLGKRRALWEALFQHIRTEHPDFVGEWRYYNDGKSWLMKVSRKKKTVFWLSVIKGAFRISAYFTDKMKPAILGSGLSDELKEQFRTGPSYGKLRGITIVFTKKRDVEDAKALISLKIM